MKKFKFYIVISIAMFLSSCSTVKEGFSNSKKNNSDEFLVEKKSPLVMPPNFDELPIPNETEIQKDLSENEFKFLITQYNKEIESNEIDIDKNFEEWLIKKIKKN